MAKSYASAPREEREKLEQQALEDVKKAISAIEEAMAAYDGAKVKPEGLSERYESFKRSHGFLTRWAREFLLERDRLTFEQRVERLKKLEFFMLYGEG